jgi:putative transposase
MNSAMIRYGSRKQAADDLGIAELLSPLKPIGFEIRVFVAAYARTKLVKTTRFSDAQIMAILKLAECGVPVTELCREHGMSSAAFYRWRAVSIREAHDRYDPKLRDENAVIEDWLIKLTDSRKRWERWPVLCVSAQCQRLQMEPQTGALHLLRTGPQLADKV